MTSKKTARSNIRKRGGTYTYYVYGMGPDGTRKQYSQGGFATQKEALAAQSEFGIEVGGIGKLQPI